MPSRRTQEKLSFFSTENRIRISVFLPFPKETVDRYFVSSVQRSYVGHADNRGEQNGGFVTAEVCEDG
jgi:hypothetical protein